MPILVGNHSHFHLTRQVAAVSLPEYALAFGDGTSNVVYDGRIPLLKNNQGIQTIQALPDPTNHQNMLMSVDPLGRPFYDNAGSHTAAHGNTGAGTGDGLTVVLTS